MPRALELQDVDAGYGEVRILFDVDLAIPRGALFALLGPNGAGKTTTLRTIAGLLKPTRGTVQLHEHDISRSRPAAIAQLGCCMIPEGRGIFPNLTVDENLLIQTHLRGRSKLDEVRETAFSRFPRLRDRRSQIAGTMSGGEQQMLALSRALTTNPSVLLLDEISMGLAPMIVEELFGVVRDLSAEGITTLIVEQRVQEALEIADYVALLNQGKVRAVGEPNDVEGMLVGSYFGGEDIFEGFDSVAPVHPRRSYPAVSDEQLLATSRGSMAHHPGCPVVMHQKHLVSADAEHRKRPCGICLDVAVYSEPHDRQVGRSPKDEAHRA